MLSKSLLKLIKSLELRKFRKENALFVAEGGKTVQDLLDLGLESTNIIATEEWMKNHRLNTRIPITVVSEEEMKKASFLRTPQGVLALFRQQQHEIDLSAPERELCLALDNVQDPGNIGTIIRIADWFGIENIYCSNGCVDIYNPKTVQATMGAIARVNVHYTPLPDLIQSLGDTPIYGTFLDGDSIYKQSLSEHGLIVMGNEGNGISQPVAALINRKLLIPNYPEGCATSESLNVAIATAVVCAEFRRTASLK